MVQFKFTYDPSISVEQRVGFELAAMIWGSYLTDDITVNLHIASSDRLGTDGQAVGGAIPLFHEQTYGVYQEYAQADATSETDAEALASQQEGNTVDFLVNGQVVDGNTDILLTSAQAKALGMDEALTLESGGIWDRNLVNADGLDGYILVSNSFDWNYDYTRSGEAPEGTLDFMSMALHEIGHQLGFVSSLDGTLDMNTLYSGETQAEGFSVLDLFRHSIDSTQVENPDGAVTDLSLGQNSYFSTDGGETVLANFADGVDYQASHWKRMQVALGIMDPTLAYRERVSLGHLDLQAMDVLGWDINYSMLDAGLDLDALLLLAENKVEASLGLSETALDSSRGGGEHGDLYTLGYGEWWAIFEKHVLELGYGEWWSIFEMGYSEWQQQFGQGEKDKKGLVEDVLDTVDSAVNLELGYGEWWQAFEANVLELGYGEWWQSFESDMLKLGYGEWWQLLELGYGEWWQKLEKYFSKLDTVNGNATKENSKKADGGVAGKNAKIYRGGEDDDIIAGDKKQDRIKAGEGDDLIDGKGGHDVIWGEAGNDMIYGHDGNDLIYGGDGNDLILGETHDDELHGEAGHDVVSGGSGDDIVTGGEGKDDLKGGWGRDVLDGGEGDDLLQGEADSDILIGGKGKDQLSGGGGNDVLYGDAYDGDKSLTQLRKQLKTQATTNESTDPLLSTDGSFNPIRVEAESMTLTGDAYIHTTWNNDSGDSVKTAGSSTATTTFSGQSGSYMVVVRYFDEQGGSGKLDFGLNGTSLNSLDLNQDTNRYYTSTVAQNLTLNTGDEFTITATSDSADDAAFDYLEFIPLDNLIETPLEQLSSSGTSTTSPTTTSTDSSVSTSTTTEATFRVEAESMTLVGDYYTEANSIASGGTLIAVSDQGEGKALSSFSGEAGYYNIVVGYYDENDDGSIAQISAALNNVELDSWSLDQQLGDLVATTNTFTTRTVASTVFLREGDIFELTGLRGEGSNSDELARVDYVDFVKVDWANGGNNEISESNEPIEAVPTTPIVIGEAIRVEAESMNLNGYQVENNSNPSGGQLIKTSSSGTAATQFTGDAGYYNIVVAYYDENDGLSRISASLDGVALDEWQLDQNLGSNFISSSNQVARTIATQIQINTGDELRLEGILNYGEHARIDYVEFVPVSAPAVPVVETNNDDFLQGGSGNDTVYGGEGNDILYGESQNDNASNVLKGAQTYNGHTYLLSSAGTWEEAQFQAQQLGGNLVTLNNAEEESWVRNTFSSTERLWTGFSDAVTEGEWQWVSGEAVTYTNWAPGEPNNYSGNQDFGTINYNNQWDDTQVTGYWDSGEQKWYNGARGVIEIDTTNNDVLVGGSGDDTIYGNGGDDALYGDEESSQSGTVNSGLVGHWTFDETAGTQAGDSTGRNSGSLTNMTSSQWTTGQKGGALNFDGSNDYIMVSDSASLDITETLTLSTWVKADSINSWDGLIVKGTDNIPYGLNLSSDGRLIFQANSGYVGGGNGAQNFYSNGTIGAGQWQHVAVTYDGSNVQFYINGQLDTSHRADITFGTNNEQLILGGDFFQHPEMFDGALDDARVYSRALSTEEITQLTTGTNSSSDGNNQSALPNGEIYNGSLYLLTDNVMTWADAQAYAETINGNLVTINNAAEDQWLKDTFGTSEALWTGFSDAETEGTWKWASGESTDWVLGGSNNNNVYVNWAPGQPDNNGDQDAAVHSYVWDDSHSGWDDTPTDSWFKGIIEIKLPSAEGNDTLYGGSGNDTLEGGAGNDVLDGTDAIAAGYFETDILGGGLGADTFVIGNSNQAYYLGGGDKDYALIQDFNAAEDIVQLHGSVGDYTQQHQDDNTYLIYQGSTPELVAVFKNVNSLNLNVGFSFV